MSAEKNSKANKSKLPVGPRSSSNDSTASLIERYRQRIGVMFADLERLSTNPACKTPEFQLELDSLRIRLCDLERQLADNPIAFAQPPAPEVQSPPIPETRAQPAAPLLYERDQVGYVFTQDRLQEIKNADAILGLNPDLAVPIVASGQPIGAVELASPPQRPLTGEEASIVDAVAQQASLQIQSLHLLAETERARAEAEAASRRFMHESWDSYLDAIHQHERIGYSYNQNSVDPCLEPVQPDTGIQEDVSVLSEQIGQVYLAPGPDHPLTEPDRQMVSSIAAQIAQQVENIRLLADASRARAEADEVMRQVTRAGWESFKERSEGESLRYCYDTNQVTPYAQELPEKAALVLPLQVRGETIGQLAVTGPEEISSEDADLAASIAVQASTHLETLRLNEELQKRAAELLELDRLKSGFLANMSHELRTPLNSILGFADVILEELDGPLTPNMSSDLRLIQKNGQHLLHLINDVLDMAKIEAGRMNLNPEKVVVHDILSEVVSITSTLASEKNLSLFIEPDSDKEVEIVADRTRIRQVMINLINNSIKFTEKGKVAIRVVKPDDEKVLISVKDTGIGIPPEKLEVIFLEFTQVDTSSTRKVGGTGLGLPISRRLVTMHGGALWAESTGVSGEGSTFFVELPLVARIVDVVEKVEK